MALPRITLRDFTDGFNTRTTPAELPPSAAQVQRLLRSDRLGRLRSVGGVHRILPDTLLTRVQGLARFKSQSDARLVYAAGGSVFAFDEYFGGSSTLLTGGSATGNFEFAAIYDKLFFCDGTSNLKMWQTTSASAFQAGITPPAAALIAAAGGAGLLNSASTGATAYQYYVTFVNAGGVESNPGPISAPLSLNNQQASLTNIAVSTDGQTIKRNIYRVGGFVTSARLVGSIANNTGTSFTDNVADTALSLTQLQWTRDVAPAGLLGLYVHKNRLFGFTGSRVYYSAFGQPEYFTATPEDVELDGGAFDVDPRFDDPIRGLCSTGSVLVIGKAKSIYLLYNNSGADFQLVKHSEALGVASARAMVRCNNTVVFLGSDGMVYGLEDSGAVALGLSIEPTLADLPAVYLSGAFAAYVDQFYVLCIPRGGAGTAPGGTGTDPLVLALDLRPYGKRAWINLSHALHSGTAFFADPTAGAGGELLMATAAGYVDPNGQSYNGIVSILSETDQTLLPFEYTSAALDFGEPNRIKKVKRIRIEGNLTLAAGDPLPAVTITATKDGRTYAKTYAFKRAVGNLLDTTTHPHLCGREITVSLSGVCRGGEINLIEMEWQIIG